MEEFSWLHLTDLHWGQEGQRHLWPGIREEFLEKLEDLRDSSGSWQVVLFTGDFTQTGVSKEFNQLEDNVFGPLWDRFRQLGGDPILLGVPGNHDLQRPDGKTYEAAVDLLLMPDRFQKISEKFWENEKSPYRKVIDKAFVNYSNWWKDKSSNDSLTINEGLLPGEFSATISTTGGRKIGIVGLNTTFLQLAAGDYQGKLASNVRQLHAACNGDGVKWANDHDICLLLTHQGPQWFDNQSREMFGEINPAGRFIVHLFGHMHEEIIRGESLAGGPITRMWQGASLFSQEQYYGQKRKMRRHGYSAGRVRFIAEDEVELRHWPMNGYYDHVNGWRFTPDHECCVLNKDGGTRPEIIKLKRGRKNSADSKKKMVDQAIENSHKHVQREWSERWSGEVG